MDSTGGLITGFTEQMVAATVRSNGRETKSGPDRFAVAISGFVQKSRSLRVLRETANSALVTTTGGTVFPFLTTCPSGRSFLKIVTARALLTCHCPTPFPILRALRETACFQSAT